MGAEAGHAAVNGSVGIQLIHKRQAIALEACDRLLQQVLRREVCAVLLHLGDGLVPLEAAVIFP